MIIVFNLRRSDSNDVMIVCLCHSVSDRTIDQVIEEGCSSLTQVVRSCKAGSDCGACRSQIKEMLRDRGHRRDVQPTSGIFSVSNL